jgi:hypothetical protein
MPTITKKVIKTVARAVVRQIPAPTRNEFGMVKGLKGIFQNMKKK